MNCEKCKDGKSYDWATVMTLYGGFTARLCTACVNAWHEYITPHPAFVEIRALEEALVLLSSRVHPTTGATEDQISEAVRLRARIDALREGCYEIGKAWARSGRESATPTNAVDPSAQPQER